MTTCILPTKAELVAYASSELPLLQFSYDLEIEQFLTVTNKYDLLLRLMTIARAGGKENGNTYFDYENNKENCQYLMYYFTRPEFSDYGYTVEPPFISGLTKPNPLDPQNPIVLTGTELILAQEPTEVNADKDIYSVKVSWSVEPAV